MRSGRQLGEALYGQGQMAVAQVDLRLVSAVARPPYYTKADIAEGYVAHIIAGGMDRDTR